MDDRFVVTLKKFFEKANVKLFTKGYDYPDEKNMPTFFLLDRLRDSYYIAETDKQPDDYLPDADISAAALSYGKSLGLYNFAVEILMNLGKQMELLPEGFEGIGKEKFGALKKKSAIVASDGMQEDMEKVFDVLQLTFNSVPLKGAFTVYFFDQDNSASIFTAYKSILDNFLIEPEPEPEDEPEVSFDAPEEPSFDADIPVEDMVLGSSDEDEEAAVNAQLAGAMESVFAKAPKEDTTDYDNPPLSFDVGSVSDPVIPDIDTDLDIDTTNDIVMKGIDQFTQDAASEFGIKASAEPPKKVAVPKLNTGDAPAPSLYGDFTEQTASAEEPAKAKKKEKKPKPVKVKAPRNTDGGIFDSLGGVGMFILRLVVFLPVTLIDLITFKKLPQFAVYWLGGLAAFYGVYHYTFGLFSWPLYNFGVEFSEAAFVQSAATAGGMEAAGAAMHALNLGGFFESIVSIITASLLAFGMQTAVLKGLAFGWALKYFIAFGFILGIIPRLRQLGKRVVVFALLFHLTMPLLVMVEGYVASSASKWLSDTASQAEILMKQSTSDAPSAEMTQEDVMASEQTFKPVAVNLLSDLLSYLSILFFTMIASPLVVYISLFRLLKYLFPTEQEEI